MSTPFPVCVGLHYKPMHIMWLHEEILYDVFQVIAISSDGKYVAVGCIGNTIMIMKLSQFKPIYTYTSLVSDATALSFSEHNQ